MRHATYIGPNEQYKGATAIIRKGKSRGKVLVQFDDIKKFPQKSHDWTEFLEKHWKAKE